MKICQISFLCFFSLVMLGCEDTFTSEDDLVVTEEEACQNFENTVGAGMIMHLPIQDEKVSNVIDPEIFAINNGGEFVEDRFGNPSQAISMEKSDEQFIEVVNPVEEDLREFTISFWVKNYYLSSSTGYILSLRGDSRFDIIVDSEKIAFKTKHRRDRYISKQTISCEINNASNFYGEWVHVVFRYSHRDRLDGFVNGEPKATTDLSDEWFEYDDAAGGSAFGCYNSSATPSNFWSGELDDIRIYDRVLCIKEIEYLAEN